MCRKLWVKRENMFLTHGTKLFLCSTYRLVTVVFGPKTWKICKICKILSWRAPTIEDEATFQMTLQSKHKRRNYSHAYFIYLNFPVQMFQDYCKKIVYGLKILEGNVWNCIFGPNNNRMFTITEFDYSKFRGFRVCNELWNVCFGLRPFWSSFKIFSKRSSEIWQTTQVQNFIYLGLLGPVNLPVLLFQRLFDFIFLTTSYYTFIKNLQNQVQGISSSYVMLILK